MIMPERVPDQIIADEIGCQLKDLPRNAEYEALKQYLLNYRKSNLGWDEYAMKKIDFSALELLERIIKECRRNGFVHCHVRYSHGIEKIVFAQIVHSKRSDFPDVMMMDLCSLCEKDCKLKDIKGNIPQSVKRCWQE